MKQAITTAVAIGILTISGICAAVEPAYEGPLGNPEEPALRPYKWMYRGMKALVYQAGTALKQGNLETPVFGTVNLGRGVRRGTMELAESTYKGALGTPLPEKKNDYKDTREVNRVVEDEWLLRNASDAAFTWMYFPLLKANDHYPFEDEKQVDQREKQAKEIRKVREARTADKENDALSGSPVQRAQRRYVGERAAKENTKFKSGRGNLLRLAK